MNEWVEGPPLYSKEDRHCWLLMHDQGGHPFVALGYIYGRFGSDFKKRHQEWVDWMKSGRKGPRPLDATIVPWIKIPSLGVDKKLDNVWNIDGHLLLNKPEIPSFK